MASICVVVFWGLSLAYTVQGSGDWLIQSKNYPEYTWGVKWRDPFEAFIVRSGDEFITRIPGRTGKPGTVSFESAKRSGYFLRHFGYFLYLENDKNPRNKHIFDYDATFKNIWDKWYPGFVSYESVNYPGFFIRHQNYRLRISKFDGSELFKKDASFKTIKPAPVVGPPAAGKTVIACENRGDIKIWCDKPNFVIKILAANYGRTKPDPKVCPYGKPHKNRCDCINDVTDKLGKFCNGKSRCWVPPTNKNFGDPCYGTYKYLEARFICIKKPDPCATVKCGKGQVCVEENGRGKCVNLCTLPAEQGPCKAYIPRYYFNTKAGECQKFIYGGCGGNANNFETLKDCERQCDPSPCDDYSCAAGEICIVRKIKCKTGQLIPTPKCVPKEKKGGCPLGFPFIFVNCTGKVNECENDYDCPGTDKCCRAICGNNECHEALDTTEKDGECPDSDVGGICDLFECSYDSECKGKKKCCTNGCGSTQCVEPAKPGSCPSPAKVTQLCFYKSCFSESDCPGAQKCCKNEKGKAVCADPH